MSFAPMVLTTGQLMAWEAVNAILGQPPGRRQPRLVLQPARRAASSGRASALVAAVMGPLVRRHMAKMIG